MIKSRKVFLRTHTTSTLLQFFGDGTVVKGDLGMVLRGLKSSGVVPNCGTLITMRTAGESQERRGLGWKCGNWCVSFYNGNEDKRIEINWWLSRFLSWRVRSHSMDGVLKREIIAEEHRIDVSQCQATPVIFQAGKEWWVTPPPP